MKIFLNPPYNTRVELDNGEDFLKVLHENGLGLRAIRFFKVEVGEIPSITFETILTRSKDTMIEVPDELCGVKVLKEEEKDD